MALKKCKECGSEVSSAAKTCPKCGIANPGKKTVGCFTIILVFFILFLIIRSCASNDSRNTPTAKVVIDSNIPNKTVETPTKEYNFEVIGGYQVHVLQEGGNTYLAHFTPAIKRDDTAVKTVFGAIGQKVFNKKLSEIGKIELAETSKPGVNGIGVFYKDGGTILFVPYKNDDGAVHSTLIESNLKK